MAPEDTNTLLSTLAQIAIATERIASVLESTPASAPDLQVSIADYWGFDWSSIGATVVESDRHGAIAVSHKGKIYTRRNPMNKYGIAIWYSRASGKDGDETIYERLITFKEVRIEADPLNEKTVALLRQIKQ